MKNTIEINNELDLIKEKTKLKLLLKYQQKDLMHMLMLLPAKFVTKGISDAWPVVNKYKITRKMLEGINIVLGGGLSRLFLAKKETHSGHSSGLIKSFKQFASVYKGYRKLRYFRTVKRKR